MLSSASGSLDLDRTAVAKNVQGFNLLQVAKPQQTMTSSDSNSGHSLWRRWILGVCPDKERPEPRLIPEIDPILVPEGEDWAKFCWKSGETHARYIPVTDLQLQQLPARWRQPHVLSDVRAIARRVVKLRVSKRSSARKGVPLPGGHTGTGFVTFDPRWGAVVHTSKHVVFDPFEAKNTTVLFFYDQEGSGSTHVIKSQGSGRHFRSVWSMDYSAFTLLVPIHEFFSQDEQRVEKNFTWRSFSLSRVLYRLRDDVDVLIISHPHGRPKQVSFGKLWRRRGMLPFMYDAATCPGSSGAPVVRLSLDYVHYLAAGQFVHHGHYDSRLSLGMGSLRPPHTLPYWSPLDGPRLRRAVGILYEPLAYWALMLVNFREVETVLFDGIDNLCYFLTLYGYFYGWRNPWVRGVFAILLTMLAFQLCRYVHAGRHWRYAVTHLVRLAHSFSMHWTTWLLVNLVPPNYLALWWVAPFWLAVLLVSRHVHLPAYFFDIAVEGRI